MLDDTYGLPIFETERLILRPIKLEDAADIFEYASDEETTRYMLFNKHENIESTLEFIRAKMEEYKGMASYDYAFVLKKENKVIGTGGGSRKDKTCHKIIIGYIINKRYWGQGLVVEAMTALIDYFFNVLDIHRVEADHAKENPNSGRVMQKLGMKFEGKSVDYYFLRGKYYDAMKYGLINPAK